MVEKRVKGFENGNITVALWTETEYTNDREGGLLMTIAEMKQKKQELGYTNAQIARLSGVPLGTVQKIFSGETACPRYDTLRAIESIFQTRSAVRENTEYYTVEEKKQGEYTLEDYYALPEDQRFELIDGYLYEMLAPVPLHQRIAGEIYRQISNYIMDNDGDCIPFISPIDVQLDCDNRTMVQPDVAILCKRDKMTRKNLYGAPDFILEVISPSTRRKDYTKKLQKYIDAGVREYWILDPYTERLLVYFFEAEVYPVICGLEALVPVNIYDGNLKINMKHIQKWIEETKELEE